MSLLSSSLRAHLVQIFAGHYPKELEPFRCELLRGQRRSVPALQDLEVGLGFSKFTTKHAIERDSSSKDSPVSSPFTDDL